MNIDFYWVSEHKNKCNPHLFRYKKVYREMVIFCTLQNKKVKMVYKFPIPYMLHSNCLITIFKNIKLGGLILSNNKTPKSMSIIVIKNMKITLVMVIMNITIMEILKVNSLFL